ncbi:uncharacterized protein LOC125675533 [Ostrea edulis]|uniref:uncharacterized protein LOC125669445 n=2 Tax=Ostrea edulis TaxID=37623 RepID=UPI00209583D9|nr:uncharacterized protein LOC125669445 [Ostrea edulis]XP_056000845.1 uncharacterized protein LOC125667448 [Ostrea edulis]XP_056009758.1 uncharacterized protein LOC125675533 [Ostrea edulis]
MEDFPKARKPNWTERERLALVEAVRCREDRLFGKMKGAGGVKNSRVKESAWEEVAQFVNAQSETSQRGIEEVKKQYSNLKQRAKEKADAIRRPATGGGPKPPSPTPVEAEIIVGMGDRPTLCGLSGGHDTEEVILYSVPNEVPQQHTYSSEIASTSSSSATVNCQVIDLGPTPSTSKRRKTMEEEEILTLRAEREAYQTKTAYYKMKMKILQSKMDKACSEQ